MDDRALISGKGPGVGGLSAGVRRVQQGEQIGAGDVETARAEPDPVRGFINPDHPSVAETIGDFAREGVEPLCGLGVEAVEPSCGHVEGKQIREGFGASFERDVLATHQIERGGTDAGPGGGGHPVGQRCRGRCPASVATAVCTMPGYDRCRDRDVEHLAENNTGVFGVDESCATSVAADGFMFDYHVGFGCSGEVVTSRAALFAGLAF